MSGLILIRTGARYLKVCIVFGRIDCMNYTATITSKGQLTIPAELFKLGKFTKGEKVNLEMEEDHLKVVSGLELVRRLAGSLKVPKRLKGLSDKEIIQDARKRHYAQKYGI